MQPPTAASAAGLSLEPGWLHGVALPVPDGELPWPGGTWGGVGWKPELSRALPSATRHGWGATPGRRRGVESIWRVRPGWLTQGTPSLLHTRGSSHTAVLIPFPVGWQRSGAPLWLRARQQRAPPHQQHAAAAGTGLMPLLRAVPCRAEPSRAEPPSRASQSRGLLSHCVPAWRQRGSEPWRCCCARCWALGGLRRSPFLSETRRCPGTAAWRTCWAG